MEGDAGADQLNPTDTDTELTAEALPETSAEDVSEAGVDPHTQPDAEDVGAAAVDESLDLEADDVATNSPAAEPERGPSRLRGRGVVGVCAVLVLLAAGAATGGYFAMRSHHESQALARNNAAAIAAARDCVAATQAPNADAAPAAARKILECSTGNFGAQAALYSDMLVQGYRAANVH
ncbi:MAG: Mce protein, partial [Mycobacterium sp.]